MLGPRFNLGQNSRLIPEMFHNSLYIHYCNGAKNIYFHVLNRPYCDGAKTYLFGFCCIQLSFDQHVSSVHNFFSVHLQCCKGETPNFRFRYSLIQLSVFPTEINYNEIIEAGKLQHLTLFKCTIRFKSELLFLFSSFFIVLVSKKIRASKHTCIESR